MRVGMALIFQSQGERIHDRNVLQEQAFLGSQAEALGFDSLWASEHHFTDYTLMPNPLQFLTYIAARTTRIQLGTMAVILPWHDPVRVAEEAVLLDHLSGGRLIFGIGRGLGRIEFEGFNVPMAESRGRFIEYAEMILTALEDGYLEYKGEYLTQPRRDLRPTPASSFRHRTYAAAVSPESAEIMARLGVGILIIPQKPWETVKGDLTLYRGAFEREQGRPAPPTVVISHVFCDEDGGRARDLGLKYNSEYYGTVLKHYELEGHHFANTAGYEYYSGMASSLETRGSEASSLHYANLHVFGTPEECVERIRWITSEVGSDTFVAFLHYGSMPFAEGERNLQLFAQRVRPRLQQEGATR